MADQRDATDFSRKLADRTGPKLLAHFEGRSSSLDLFMRREVRSEEWFRLEILVAFESAKGVTIQATNRTKETSRERPDFVIQLGDQTGEVELKLLPADRNFPRGWQCFQSGLNNQKDFENLQDGKRDAIIYLHWPSADDWAACSANLQQNYRVVLVRADSIQTPFGTVTISYWGPYAGVV